MVATTRSAACQSAAQEVEESVLVATNDNESSADPDPTVVEWVDAAPTEIARDIEADESPPPLPPVVGPLEPPKEGIDYKLCREELSKFFTKRVSDRSKTMVWALRDQFPRAGKDTELDKLLEDLGLANNRRYASQKWLAFKKAKGIVPPPTFECSANEIFGFAASLVAAEIFGAAVKKTTTELRGDTYNGCLFLAWHPLIQSYLIYEVGHFTEQLREALEGAKPTTIDGNINTMSRKIKKDRRMKLIKLIHILFPYTEAKKVGVFFGELHHNLYEEWESAIAQNVTPNMENDVEDCVIKERLTGCNDTLCYISGWLLNKMLHVNMSGIDKPLLSKFVASNSTSKIDSRDSIPSGVIDQREKREDALKRPGEAWFQFMCLLESIFLVNMTAVQVLHHRGRVLQKITAAAMTSDALRLKFIQCIPNDFDIQQIKRLWRVYYLLLIPTYGALKSSDVIRRVREARPATAQDKMPIRTYALAEYERVKKANK